MNWSPDTTPLICIVTEGCVDAFCGRPLARNPYCPESATDYWLAWDFGWHEARHLLEIRGREEAARWLREAA